MITPIDSAVLEFSFRDIFDAEAWERLAEMAERVELPAGSVLMRRGEAGPPLHVIEDGTLEVIDARSSPETVLNVLGPGHVVGDMSFIDRAPASAEVRARTHARCLRWAPAELHAALLASPDLALEFYRALATTVVARTRTVMSSAVLGGFGLSAAPRAGAELAGQENAAQALAEAIRGPIARAQGFQDPRAGIELADALTGACRWFTVASETGGAEEVGVRLRELLADELGSSLTAAELLTRPDGVPAGPDFFRHVLDGRPSGRDEAGTLLDGALLQLPTFRGWRWRDAALAGALEGALPASGARVLSLSLSGAPTSEAQLAPLRRRAGHVTSVQLAQRGAPSPTPAGITRAAFVADLHSLLRGSGPRLGGPHHAVIVDRVCDVIPDEVLRSLLAWARSQLDPAGQLLVGHAAPADDNSLLDHLLRWPSLPRRTSALVALLPSGGSYHTQAPLDDEAAGLLIWRART